MKNIQDLFTVHKRLQIDNRSPLESESEGIYLVESGRVYLFAVNRQHDGSYGARYQITYYEQGDLFFSLTGTDDVSFIFTGSQDTKIFQVEPDSFFDIYQQYPDESDALLSIWIQNSSYNLRRGSISPKMRGVIEKSGSYPPGVALYSPGLHWVKVHDEATVFNNTPLHEWAEDTWFPVTNKQVVIMNLEQDVAVTTSAVLSKEPGGLRLSLFRYVSSLAHFLVLKKFEILEIEDQSIQDKFNRSAEAFSRSLENIRQVLKLGRPLITGSLINKETLLFETAKVVAQFQKISLTPIDGKEYTLESNGIQELAKDNNIRVREVILKGDWWKEDTGPLLCNWESQEDSEESGEAGTGVVSTPIALIPGRGLKYKIINLYDGSDNILTQANARNVSPRAHMFYRVLPQSKIGLKQIIRFGSVGLSGDLLRYVLMGILVALIGLLIPEMTRIFIDTIIPEAATNRMIQITFLLVVSTFAAGIFELVKGIAMTRLETKADSALQAAIWDRVLKLKVPFFRDYTAGDLTDRSMAISSIRRIISGAVIAGMMSFLFSLVYLFQIFRYSPELAKVGLYLCLIPITISALASFFQYRFEKEVAGIQGKITGLLFQFVRGVPKLNSTASEHHAFGVWAGQYAKKEKLSYKGGIVSNILTTVVSFFPLVVTMIFYFSFISKSEVSGSLSTGSFLAFIASFSAFQSALIGMINSLTGSVNVIPLYKRAKPILEAELEISEAKPSVSHLDGHIEVNQVDFRYAEDGPLILNNVSLKVAPGDFVALVGSSGSGKSTLLRLLLGFEKPESGSIFYDNQDMESLDISSIRRKIGVVLQNGSIMQGSIYKNIIGNSPLTIEDAWDAARMVGFEKDIEEMPMGMNTEITVGGGTLSGGQRQRLIIAKAIIHRPNILFFDEATSALDNKTQRIVSDSLRNLNVARVVIAHRLSTIIDADQIHVLEGGVLIESGNYRELMDKDGFFAKLANRQNL